MALSHIQIRDNCSVGERHGNLMKNTLNEPLNLIDDGMHVVLCGCELLNITSLAEITREDSSLMERGIACTICDWLRAAMMHAKWHSVVLTNRYNAIFYLAWDVEYLNVYWRRRLRVDGIRSRWRRAFVISRSNLRIHMYRTVMPFSPSVVDLVNRPTECPGHVTHRGIN